MSLSLQSSMGYICSNCGKTFLIGWKNAETNKRYCDCCKDKNEDVFIEVVY